jgi:hypothetical protein
VTYWLGEWQVKVSYISSHFWLQLLLRLGSDSVSVQDLLPVDYGEYNIASNVLEYLTRYRVEMQMWIIGE